LSLQALQKEEDDDFEDELVAQLEIKARMEEVKAPSATTRQYEETLMRNLSLQTALMEQLVGERKATAHKEASAATAIAEDRRERLDALRRAATRGDPLPPQRARPVLSPVAEPSGGAAASGAGASAGSALDMSLAGLPHGAAMNPQELVALIKVCAHGGHTDVTSHSHTHRPSLGSLARR
jgi:hypothetical protein